MVAGGGSRLAFGWMSPFGPRFAPHAAAHSAQSFDALSAGLADPLSSFRVGDHEDVEQHGRERAPRASRRARSSRARNLHSIGNYDAGPDLLVPS